MDPKVKLWRVWTGLIDSGWGLVTGSFDHGNEPVDSCNVSIFVIADLYTC